jgi:hypothetical protein
VQEDDYVHAAATSEALVAVTEQSESNSAVNVDVFILFVLNNTFLLLGLHFTLLVVVWLEVVIHVQKVLRNGSFVLDNAL